jgi:hypothetical protein
VVRNESTLAIAPVLKAAETGTFQDRKVATDQVPIVLAASEGLLNRTRKEPQWRMQTLEALSETGPGVHPGPVVECRTPDCVLCSEARPACRAS